MRVPILKRFQLTVVSQIINWLNFILLLLNKILFRTLKSAPNNILVYKVGNIGDIVCTIPALIAIRRTYPKSKITLLTSPGVRGMPTAKDLIAGAWYINEIITYYAEDIAGFQSKKDFIKKLRRENYDFFIQIPDDWTTFSALLRNMIFAKLSGIKSAGGFRLRTIIGLFKNTQIDYRLEKTEAEKLLEILKDCKIINDSRVEFFLEASDDSRIKVKEKLDEFSKDAKLVVGICPGGKLEIKRWSAEKFGVVAEYLESKYGAKFIFFGGTADQMTSEIAVSFLNSKLNAFIAAGKLNLSESFFALKYCHFLLSNDTGIIHIAAAINKPVVALFSVWNIFGKWFPYGENHECLYKRFLNCDYKKDECIKKSIEAITVEEVKAACDRVIARLKLKSS